MPTEPAAAKPATTEPAAAKPATLDAGPEPAVAAAAPAVKEPAGPEPDVKEQFRLALERKRGKSSDAHGGGPAAGGKVGTTQGRAGNKREFRRKSGG